MKHKKLTQEMHNAESWSKKTTTTKHQSNMWWVSMEVNHWRQLLPESQILFFTTKAGQFRNAIRELKEQNSHIQLTTEYIIWIRDIIGRVVMHTWRCLGGYCCTLWAASQSCLSAESPSGRERREMKRRWREKGGILSVTGIEGVERGRGGGGDWEEQRWG